MMSVGKPRHFREKHRISMMLTNKLKRGNMSQIKMGHFRYHVWAGCSMQAMHAENCAEPSNDQK